MSNDLMSRRSGGAGGSTRSGSEQHGMPGKRTLVEQVQMRGGEQSGAAVHATAARGVATPATSLPFASAIQRSFGRHDVSSVQAHAEPEAAESAASMGADAYAAGDHVVLGKADLHTVAHEAAHVVQQRSGVQLKGGVGQTGDEYEQHADAVADKVVAGESAEPLLSAMAGPDSATGAAQQPAAAQSQATPQAEASVQRTKATGPQAEDAEHDEHAEHEASDGQQHDESEVDEPAPKEAATAAPEGNAAPSGEAPVQMKAAASSPTAVQLKRTTGGYRAAPSLAAARAGRASIRRGMKGSSVRFVQQHVHSAADGLFGPNTQAAVKRFQRAHHLEVDGIVGPHTMAAMDHGGGGGGGAPAHDDGGSHPTGTEAHIRDQVVAKGKSHLGARYSWAAEGPSMFDCSGFAWYVLHTDMHLTSAGRTTAAGLSHAPYTTPTSSPQKGDLVFYSSGGISHVTIALGHGSEVIGASGGGSHTHGQDPNAKVKYGDWNRDRRHKTFGSIRGLINRKK